MTCALGKEMIQVYTLTVVYSGRFRKFFRRKKREYAQHKRMRSSQSESVLAPMLWRSRRRVGNSDGGIYLHMDPSCWTRAEKFRSFSILSLSEIAIHSCESHKFIHGHPASANFRFCKSSSHKRVRLLRGQNQAA
jgi:hypothetical protein